MSILTNRHKHFSYQDEEIDFINYAKKWSDTNSILYRNSMMDCYLNIYNKMLKKSWYHNKLSAVDEKIIDLLKRNDIILYIHMIEIFHYGNLYDIIYKFKEVKIVYYYITDKKTLLLCFESSGMKIEECCIFIKSKLNITTNDFVISMNFIGKYSFDNILSVWNKVDFSDPNYYNIFNYHRPISEPIHILKKK